MYEVRIYEGDPPCLITDSRDEALSYWKANSRKVYGQVGVFDRVNRRWIA